LLRAFPPDAAARIVALANAARSLMATGVQLKETNTPALPQAE
jgi:hypothetical protein